MDLVRRPALQPLGGALQGLGLPAALGVAALLLAAALEFGITPYWQQQARQAAQAARSERIAVADAARAKLERTHSGTEAPAWPPLAERERRLAHLLALARHQGVELKSLSQPTAAAPAVAAGGADGPAWQPLVLPVRAPYAALRGFISAALADDPALALEAVQWRREGSDRGELDAEITWSMAYAPPRSLP